MTQKAEPAQKAAVFLDRDGTIMEDRGFVDDPGEVRLLPGAVEALKALQGRYVLFVVTNQSGIARGAITREGADRVNRFLDGELQRRGVDIREWYVCPHGPGDGCRCRKPSSFFLEEAAREFGVDLSRSFVVGDHPHDPETADGTGAFGLYVLTGHGQRHLEELPEGQLVFHALPGAAEWILGHPEPQRDLEENLQAGAAALRAGGLTAFATETVYGLGADALNPEAVEGIFRAKGRPHADPLIVHIARREQLKGLVREVPPAAEVLMDRWWPGPLTVVLPKSEAVPEAVTAGHPTVAVRMPAHPLARRLIEAAGVPVAAPSANIFGRTSPTTAAHVADQLGQACDVIVDAGACRVGVESTVVSLTGEVPVLLREGGVTREELEEVLGVPVAGSAGRLPEEERISPGLMESHYAPQVPLVLAGDWEGSEGAELRGDPQTGILYFGGEEESQGEESRPGDFAGPVEVLSRRGDAREAAVNLYAALRRLDGWRDAGGRRLRRMAAVLLPETGAGAAVNDRLRKAAGRGGEPVLDADPRP